MIKYFERVLCLWNCTSRNKYYHQHTLTQPHVCEQETQGTYRRNMRRVRVPIFAVEKQ